MIDRSEGNFIGNCRKKSYCNLDDFVIVLKQFLINFKFTLNWLTRHYSISLPDKLERHKNDRENSSKLSEIRTAMFNSPAIRNRFSELV